jgi:hypothetical protein
MHEPKAVSGPRDDAQVQPESGYPDGRLPVKPSADLDASATEREAQLGSEAEFDSKSVKNTDGRES